MTTLIDAPLFLQLDTLKPAPSLPAKSAIDDWKEAQGLNEKRQGGSGQWYAAAARVDLSRTLLELCRVPRNARVNCARSTSLRAPSRERLR